MSTHNIYVSSPLKQSPITAGQFTGLGLTLYSDSDTATLSSASSNILTSDSSSEVSSSSLELPAKAPISHNLNIQIVDDLEDSPCLFSPSFMEQEYSWDNSFDSTDSEEINLDDLLEPHQRPQLSRQTFHHVSKISNRALFTIVESPVPSVYVPSSTKTLVVEPLETPKPLAVSVVRFDLTLNRVDSAMCKDHTSAKMSAFITRCFSKIKAFRKN